MRFDVNLGKMPALTIAFRFARENTNDEGEPLQIQTAEVILYEFKKFIYLAGIEINKRRREGHSNYNSKLNVFECPYTPPSYIDRMWRTMILYDRHYEALCKLVCGGLIERPGNAALRPNAFQEYKDLRFAVY